MNITYFRVFLGILGHYSIQYLNFAKKWFNSLFNSKISRKFNSKKYSIQKFARKFNSKKYSIQKFAIQKIFNSKICKKIQFKIWFKMLNLAGFNSTIYSFNNKTWVSLTPRLEPDSGRQRSAANSIVSPIWQKGSSVIVRIREVSELLKRSHFCLKISTIAHTLEIW